MPLQAFIIGTVQASTMFHLNAMVAQHWPTDAHSKCMSTWRGWHLSLRILFRIAILLFRLPSVVAEIHRLQHLVLMQELVVIKNQ